MDTGCVEWVLFQVRVGRRFFAPKPASSHWTSDAQVHVLALNWRDRGILLGECKWGSSPVGRSVVRELVGKTPKVAPGDDWQVHHASFARAGFTDAARAKAEVAGAILVDLMALDQDLRRALETG